MEKYMNRGIKQVITEFPEVGQLLEEYNIGCVPCTVGTCLLKDIVEIHNLSPGDEQNLMRGIAGIIFPGEQVEISVNRRKHNFLGEISYSPPMKRLVDEHVLIKRFLGLIPSILENLDVETEEDRNLIMESVGFIRFYADKLHHAKEEDILFSYFDRDSEIIAAMLEDHTQARAHVRGMVESAEKGDNGTVREHLEAYMDLLYNHIKREDEILYPWMDRNLSVSQIGNMFTQFNEADEESGDIPETYRKFVEKLEKQYQPKEVL